MILMEWARKENARRYAAYREARMYQLSLEAEGERWAMEHMRRSHERLAAHGGQDR
jgi:hypothetical protein